MTRWQCNHIIGIMWLFMAAFDKPIDQGSLIYVAVSLAFLIASLTGWLKEKTA